MVEIDVREHGSELSDLITSERVQPDDAPTP